MNVKKIEFIKKIRPQCSCGTGYGEPDVFDVILENGIVKRVLIDMWYVPDELRRERFREQFNREMWLDLGDHVEEIYIENMDDAFDMYEHQLNEHWKERL